jgi:hypothetical protein
MNKKILYWYKKYTPKLFQKGIKKIIPSWIEYIKLDWVSNKNIDFSGHGEMQAIKNFLRSDDKQINFFVDVGASDGVSSSSTLEFAKDTNWSGLSIEFDKKKFSKMKYVYRKYNNIKLDNSKVTPENVRNLFDHYSVPKSPTFINIDIDSYDLDVVISIFDAGYFPDIVSIEINEKIPPPIYFKVLYHKDHFWKEDHFYGCSITAAEKEFSKKGYLLADLKLNNAIFINKSVFPNTKPLDTLTAYRDGYLNVPNRKNLFKYNHDVEILLSLNNPDKIKFLDNLFLEYKNLYELKVVEDSE